MSWGGADGRGGMGGDVVGRVEWAAMPLLARATLEDEVWLVRGAREVVSLPACVLMPCVIPVTGRVTSAAA
ncbi:hypothetical protein QQY24_00350 [Streptomyces sp. TG1A-8]|uniref:hypothetical protein n=1 Tax=Streptomyces sp. TG1A-8 TaxID=3051385 RepID=UPI00265C4222|nr:hypothetical protein [Streptomyces sp. TG1A-8]MDO0923978.1 hypothetical protein [Streptomyces sp. TG1A-8]